MPAQGGWTAATAPAHWLQLDWSARYAGSSLRRQIWFAQAVFVAKDQQEPHWPWEAGARRAG